MSTKAWLLLCVVSLAFIPKSDSAPLNSETADQVELSLTPLACFVKKNGDVCHITVKIDWHSNQLVSMFDSILSQANHNHSNQLVKLY